MTGRKLKNDDTRPPQNPYVGQMWFDQMLGRARRWDGKEWADYTPGELSQRSRT